MKIIIDYDLMDKIKKAQMEPKYKLIKGQVLSYGAYYGLVVALNLVLRNSLSEAFTNAIRSPILLFAFYNTLGGIYGSHFSIVAHKERIDSKQLKMTRELLALISQMGERNINTNLDYLYQAEDYKTTYRLENGGGKRHTVQDKYIMLPTTTFTGDRKDISLHQEHIVRSKEWTLSLGSPTKQLKLAPSFG